MSYAPPVLQTGTGNTQGPELLIRQVLLEAFVELAGDEARLNDLFQRDDTLRQGTQEETRQDFKAVIRRMAVIGAEGGINIGTSHPMDDAALPYVSVMTTSAAENAGGACLGDILGQTYEVTGTFDATDPTTSRTNHYLTIGCDMSGAIEVGCWATGQEEAMCLLAAVFHLLFRHKGRLDAVGFRDATLSIGGFDLSAALLPRTSYVPIVTVAGEWTHKQNRITANVPTRATLTLSQFSN